MRLSELARVTKQACAAEFEKLTGHTLHVFVNYSHGGYRLHFQARDGGRIVCERHAEVMLDDLRRIHSDALTKAVVDPIASMVHEIEIAKDDLLLARLSALGRAWDAEASYGSTDVPVVVNK